MTQPAKSPKKKPYARPRLMRLGSLGGATRTLPTGLGDPDNMFVITRKDPS